MFLRDVLLVEKHQVHFVSGRARPTRPKWKHNAEPGNIGMNTSQVQNLRYLSFHMHLLSGTERPDR